MLEVREIHRQHTSPSSSDPTKPWSDIGYSWLVDDFGNSYEGRGWLRSQAATVGHNSTSHSICWMGNSMTRQPSNKALACIAQLIVDGQKVGAVTNDCTISGHRDANSTACPGDLLYAQLPIIRAAVLDLPPATIDPPEDDMTEDESRMLREVHFWIANGYIPGGTVAAMRPDIDAIAGKLDSIEKRLGALEAGEVPSADDLVTTVARRIIEGAPK